MKKSNFWLFIAILIFGIGFHAFTFAEGNEEINNSYRDSGPKNVILLIGDGMGMGQIEIARQMEYGKEGRLFLESLPFVSLVHTSSANYAVTDSAAGGTALAIGKKTNNGMIGITADGHESDSILDLFKSHDKKTGVISTNTVTDATPAAFTASVKNRWTRQNEIARQQLENKVDVLLGGGADFFRADRQNGRDLIKEAIHDGYTFVSTRDELLAAKGNRMLGLFHPSYMSFKLDRKLLRSQEPSLKEMTEIAIEFLSKGEKGFFLMSEGARIDHASHAADLTSVWKEVIEFDNAVKYAVNWARREGNTLVLVVADHETMGISATEPLNIEGLKEVKATPEYMVSKFIRKTNSLEFEPNSVQNTVKKYANIELTADEMTLLNERVKNAQGAVYPQHQAAWVLGSIIAKHYHAGIADPSIRSISSSTGGHTANPIPLFAYGKGAEFFNGVLDNTDIPKKIAELMGYEWE
ncbi:alkaline phosphatase [Bacillus sp. FJAT-29937]|uniref:alkaline phosphatase n=1 Tax=Bacillus sp. FJAT-29937 TaxID=1720553 RepID=UPI00082BF645|nr:alkaline phosphatase [Bacillus sp. FJAT-29937]